MEKSIKKNWKEGFLNDSNLKTPEINNLFQRKSILIVDKLIDRMNFEFKLLIPIFIITFFLTFLLSNNIIISLVSAFPFLIWGYIAIHQIRGIKRIRAEDNCFMYLKQVQHEVKRIYNYNLKATIASVFLICFPMLLYLYFINRGETIGAVFNIPNVNWNIVWIFIFLPFLMIMSYLIFKVMYRLTNHTERKLEKLLKEIEELKAK